MNVSAVTRLRVNLKLKYFKDYTHNHGFVITIKELKPVLIGAEASVMIKLS